MNNNRTAKVTSTIMKIAKQLLTEQALSYKV